jgi:glycosyltransferase involved in cell wall biosynthesis
MTRNIRVLMLGPFPESLDFIHGGVATVMTYLSAALAQRSDIELFGARVDVSPERNLGGENFDFPIFRIDRKSFGLITNYGAQRRALREIIQKIQPDVIHGQGADLPGYLAVRSGLPHVITVHGMIGAEARFRRSLIRKLRTVAASRLIEYRTVSVAQNVILISSYAEQYYREHLTGARFHVPNPVADRFFDVDPSPEKGRILFAGRINKGKGILELISAVSRIRETTPVTLHIAGSIADKEYYRRVLSAIESARLGGAVQLHGLLDQAAILDQFARASVLALPSFQENAPMVIQEAMAVGLPVVATDVGGVRDQIDDGKSGYVVPPGDVSQLAARLQAVLSDRSHAGELAARARQVAKSRFTAGRVAQQTVEVYSAALERARHSPSTQHP